MKKVIILAMGITLMASSAFAAISGTAHDLSTFADSQEICVFCHTPHGGSDAAPLWNRSDIGYTATLYNSSTTTAATNAASITDTDVPLCMSCHDGSTNYNNIINPTGDAVYTSASMSTTSLAAIGSDTEGLTNDHPIGMNYSLAVTQDDGGLNSGITLPLWSGVMWCSSCHDVHDDTINPFLNMSMSGSDLCLECHAK